MISGLSLRLSRWADQKGTDGARSGTLPAKNRPRPAAAAAKVSKKLPAPQFVSCLITEVINYFLGQSFVRFHAFAAAGGSVN